MSTPDDHPSPPNRHDPHRRPRARLGRHWIDDWRPEDPDFWNDRRADRQPQPDLLGALRAHRLLGLEPVVGARAVPRARSTASTRPASSCSPRCPPWSAPCSGCPYTFAVGDVRRPELDHRQRAAAADPDDADRDRAGARRLLHDPVVVAMTRRRRRRQLRLVDDEHQRLLPGPAQGLGARRQRRRRQPRRPGGAAGRPAGPGHRSARSTRGCWWSIYIPLIILAAIGAALMMNNLTQRQQREGRHPRGHAGTARPGSCRCSTSAPSGRSSASASPSGRCCWSSSPSSSRPRSRRRALTFLGPLLGSLIRPVGGALADRFGGLGRDVLQLHRHGAGARSSCWSPRS